MMEAIFLRMRNTITKLNYFIYNMHAIYIDRYDIYLYLHIYIYHTRKNKKQRGILNTGSLKISFE